MNYILALCSFVVGFIAAIKGNVWQSIAYFGIAALFSVAGAVTNVSMEIEKFKNLFKDRIEAEKAMAAIMKAAHEANENDGK